MKLIRRHKGFFISFILLLIGATFSAQIDAFRNVNDDGIVDFQVNALFKDSQGFLWTGGTFLVQRYDGITFKTYPLPYKVNDINETKDGTLYFATANGLYCLKRNRSEIISVSSDQLFRNTYAIHIDSCNDVYVGTENGLVILSKDNFESVQIQNPDFPFNQVIAIEQSTDNALWLLTPGGLVNYNITTKKIARYAFLPETNNSYCTCMTKTDSMLYIGTKENGIFSFNPVSEKIIPFMTVGNGAITCISYDKNSKLYAGTAGTGIFSIDIAGQQIYQSYNSNQDRKLKLSSNMITTLLIDDLDILWVGNSENLGFDYTFLNHKAFRIFETPSFSTRNLPVNQFFIGDDFKLLSGLNGLYYISDSDGKAQIYEAGIGKAQSLKTGKINTIVPYKNTIILGGSCGIYVFDPSDLSLNTFAPFSSLNDKTIFHITTDKFGNLWVASTAGLSVLYAGNNTVKNYNTLNSNLRSDSVHFVYFDSHHKIWVCTNKGICFWDAQNNDFHNGDLPDNFIQNEDVHYIIEDRKGNYIFCYNDRNVMLASADLNQFRQICNEEDAGFTGLQILKVLQDKSGTFWFIGSRGAIKANESFTHFELYSISEGLLEPYVTDACIDNTGSLWLSNQKGLYHASDNFIRHTVPLEVTDIKINGVSQIDELQNYIENDKPFILRRKQNNIEFQFALLDYIRPDLKVYECKLNYPDGDWKILRGLNHINYKNLSVGDYSFAVRYNMDKDSTRHIHFVIKPLFSKFVLLLMLILCIGICWFIFYVIKRKKASVVLEKTAADKSDEEKYQFNKITDDKADDIILQLKECMEKKQMFLNPNLKISDLSKEIGCSNQMLSQVFNLFLKEKYNEFVSHYRVEEFKRIVSGTDFSKYTIKALAQKSGFSSYTSFYRAFKNETGITPNAYIKNIELE